MNKLFYIPTVIAGAYLVKELAEHMAQRIPGGGGGECLECRP